MIAFFDSFLEEAIQRRQRIATTIGPRFQGVFDLMLLGGVTVGSLGLLVRPWMAQSAPWGFALPVVFLAGHVLLDARRQAQLARGGDPEAVRARADLFAVAWGIGCAAVGAATFFLAFQDAPPPPPPAPVEEWSPPHSAFEVDIAR